MTVARDVTSGDVVAFRDGTRHGVRGVVFLDRRRRRVRIHFDPDGDVEPVEVDGGRDVPVVGRACWSCGADDIDRRSGLCGPCRTDAGAAYRADRRELRQMTARKRR